MEHLYRYRRYWNRAIFRPLPSLYWIGDSKCHDYPARILPRHQVYVKQMKNCIVYHTSWRAKVQICKVLMIHHAAGKVDRNAG